MPFLATRGLGSVQRRRSSILAKATGTHYGTKTPSVLLYKTACREKVNYRGRRGMWWVTSLV